MLTFLDDIHWFIEEVNKLWRYPEITSNDTMVIKFNNLNTQHNPSHNWEYDERLFEWFANSIRKLLILEWEPIGLKKIHKLTIGLSKISKEQHAKLGVTYSKIQNYLGKNINAVTPFRVSLPWSMIENTTVKDLLNDYFASTIQHSKPETQRRIAELNSLTFWNISEIVRKMMLDLTSLLQEYIIIMKSES